MTLNLRVIFDGSSLTFTPDPAGENAADMRREVEDLAQRWMRRLELHPKPGAFSEATFEFVSQDTLDYIEKLEDVLEWLRGDDNTPDEVMARIDEVLR